MATGGDDEEERAKAVRNERIKLSATFLNTVAAGCVVVGIIAPVASLVLGTTAPASGGALVGLVLALLTANAGPHSLARTIFGRLRP